jgi:fumarylacetoacetase
MKGAFIVDGHKRAWIPYDEQSDFPIQNLPLGIFSTEGESKRVCTIIGDTVIDLYGLSQYGVLNESELETSEFQQDFLNPILQHGKKVIRELRKDLSEIFDQNNTSVDRELCKKHFYNVEAVNLHLPVKPGNYTDFYSSREHATNVGTMFRDPANALLPNWLHLPVGYHGRASSIVVSGTDIIRPNGQMQLKDGEAPVFGPSKQLDIELEMAFVIGEGNDLGHPIPIAEAEEHIQGLLIFNDWSARDIQKWEYVPLGPFLAKNFASTVSPWLVDLDALQVVKVQGPEPATPQLDYLKINSPSNYDIQLEVILQTANGDQNLICKSNMKYLYWSMSQQLAHHTVNGCNMEVGDICASGTISGPEPDSYGSLLELSWKGTKPLTMKDGTTRTFLQDGDIIIMRAFAQHENYRIGFGEARGKIVGKGKGQWAIGKK